MSAPAQGSSSATQAATSDAAATEANKDAVKPTAALEEDDEFEDFPTEGPSVPSVRARGDCARLTADGLIVHADWTQEETEVTGTNTHLWEESWDDDDTSEDFSAQLKYVVPSLRGGPDG